MKIRFCDQGKLLIMFWNAIFITNYNFEWKGTVLVRSPFAGEVEEWFWLICVGEMGHSLLTKAIFNKQLLWNFLPVTKHSAQNRTSSTHTAGTQKWLGSNYELPTYPSSWMWSGKPLFFHCDGEKPQWLSHLKHIWTRSRPGKYTAKSSPMLSIRGWMKVLNKLCLISMFSSVPKICILSPFFKESFHLETWTCSLSVCLRYHYGVRNPLLGNGHSFKLHMLDWEFCFS